MTDTPLPPECERALDTLEAWATEDPQHTYGRVGRLVTLLRWRRDRFVARLYRDTPSTRKVGEQLGVSSTVVSRIPKGDQTT